MSGGIKYYRLKDGEDLPDEFCAVRDADGEPSEYAWYEPMNSFDRKLQAENAKLRKKVRQDHDFMVHLNLHEAYPSSSDIAVNVAELSELGIEVDG